MIQAMRKIEQSLLIEEVNKDTTQQAVDRKRKILITTQSSHGQNEM